MSQVYMLYFTCVFWQLAARGLKVGMIAATPAAAPVSSSSESPPPQTETVVTAVASTPPKPSTPDISMTAALKNVGVVSVLVLSLFTL